MKKSFRLVLFASFVCTTAINAQVQFSKLGFKEALEKAKATNKMVMFAIEALNCDQCNTVAGQGFSNTLLGRSVNENCISLLYKRTDKDFPMLDSLYGIGSNFGIWFVDADGTYLHKYNGSSSYYITYMEQLEKAIKKHENPDTLFKQLQTAYNEGNRSFETLYQLVAKRNEAGQNIDLLAEEMLNLAPKDSAASIRFLQYVAALSPLVGSKTERYMRSNNQLFNEAWYQLSLQKRITINNQIISKSRAKAIKEKNELYAEQVAYFSSATNGGGIAGRKSHDRSMIEFYKAVQDTSKFLLASVKYYNEFLMSINVDSILRVDSIRRNELIANSIPGKVIRQSNPYPVMQTSIQFAPASQNYTNELNNAAWTIYRYTHDPYYTAQALSWSKRALEFFESPAAMDTHAKLLYRTGNKKEAIEWLEKAATLIREKKAPPFPANIEQTLQKMKQDTMPIDEY